VRSNNLFLVLDFMVNYLQVLAIADGLHDVYVLGKEAAAVHNSLMSNLSKVCYFFSLILTWFWFFIALPSFSPLFCLCFSAPVGFISSLPQLAWD
jgi:hypothetical protein